MQFNFEIISKNYLFGVHLFYIIQINIPTKDKKLNMRQSTPQNCSPNAVT